MNNRLIACFTLGLLLLAAGCGPARIDASSAESMKVSIAHVRSNLGEEKRNQFDKALQDIDRILFDPSFAVTQATVGFSRPEMLARKILNNKTAEEVIIMVESYKIKFALPENKFGHAD